MVKLPKFEEVKHEMLPLIGFSDYMVHPHLGKIYKLSTGKWMLEGNLKGVGDKGYLMTNLKNDNGKRIQIYEHEAVYAAVWGEPIKSWRFYGKKLEIDHIDHDVKNNSIENLRLVTSADNKKNRSYDIERNKLTYKNAEYIRNEFTKWQGSKMDFYETMAIKFDVTKRTIQNAVLGYTYNKLFTYDIDKTGIVNNFKLAY